MQDYLYFTQLAKRGAQSLRYPAPVSPVTPAPESKCEKKLHPDPLMMSSLSQEPFIIIQYYFRSIQPITSRKELFFQIKFDLPFYLLRDYILRSFKQEPLGCHSLSNS